MTKSPQFMDALRKKFKEVQSTYACDAGDPTKKAKTTKELEKLLTGFNKKVDLHLERVRITSHAPRRAIVSYEKSPVFNLWLYKRLVKDITALIDSRGGAQG
jgi:hypothetical protein